jgi:predicted nucleic acid-binding protein
LSNYPITSNRIKQKIYHDSRERWGEEMFTTTGDNEVTQIIVSVFSESKALMLKKHPMAKEMWDRFIAEIMKKLKIVLTNLQRQLRNIKCSEEDYLYEHLG